jgi:hypothetical protein
MMNRSVLVLFSLLLFSLSVNFFLFKQTKVALPPEKYLVRSRVYFQFTVCGGLTNQVLAIQDALLIAHILDATLILPGLMSEYTLKEPDMEFDDIFSSDVLISRLRGHVLVVKPSRKLQKIIQYNPVVFLNLDRAMKTVSSLRSAVYVDSNVSNTVMFTLISNCPLFSVDIRENEELLKLRWKIFDSFVLRHELDLLKDQIVARIGFSFNALHLRLERDWIDHCHIWQDQFGNNCDFPVPVLPGSVLERSFAIEVEHLNPNLPIYVASGLTRSDVCQHPAVGMSFCNKFRLIFKSDVLDEVVFARFKKEGPNRELYAALEYCIVSRAESFVGNSVSTFSALQMLQRKHAGRKSFQYNGGNIPLEAILGKIHKEPQLKWVFAYSSGSPQHVFDHVKVAVLSAKLNTLLVPYCIVNEEDHVTKWLRSNGVSVIVHRLKWNEELVQQHLKKDFTPKFFTHLTSVTAIQGCFARMDIPILGWMDEFVLYTDVDVMFLSDISLSQFKELPKYFLCGPETEKSIQRPPCNDGVMLVNVRNMANSYSNFSKFILNNPTNLEFRHGPLDQGAFNDFYSDSFKTYFSDYYNWKPYWNNWSEAREFVKLVHFHGPKIVDYENKFSNSTHKPMDGFLRLLQMCDERDSSCKALVYLFKWVLGRENVSHCDTASMRYLVQNNDVLFANMGAWKHFKQYGEVEGRRWVGNHCEQ